MHGPDRRQSTRRLALLHGLELLDTPAEASFDAMTRLAATLLGAQASFIALVDADRDFYKSQFGFPEDLAASRQIAGDSFCHHAIRSREPLSIPDTHASALWRAVPTVQSLGVRAYLGVSVWIDGEPIGSFCVVDTRPRDWTAAEIDTVRELAKSVGREIDLRSALRGSLHSSERARALAKKNEELVAVVAHDLRTPLQIMSMTAAVMARSTDESTQTHARRIDSATQSATRLVEDLLMTNAVDSGPSHRKAPVGVRPLLQDALETMSVVAARHDIALWMGEAPDVAVWVDHAQMLRALCNLIGNALKYCPAGSMAVLGATLDAQAVTLTVLDDGPGMSADERARAFDRGWQGAAGIALQQGSGLGLSIVQSLVEQNGGTVSLTSPPGAGTVVSIRLPRH